MTEYQGRRGRGNINEKQFKSAYIMRPVLGNKLLQTISFYFQFVELRVLTQGCYTTSLWEGVRVKMGVRGS